MRTRPRSGPDDEDLTEPIPRVGASQDERREPDSGRGQRRRQEQSRDLDPDADADAHVDGDLDAGVDVGGGDVGSGEDDDEGGDRDREQAAVGGLRVLSELRALRTRRRRWLVAGGVLVALLIGSAFVPSVNTVLRQSFTRLPSAYTELYFTAAPTVNGIELTVPVTVVAHQTGAKSVTLKVWLVDKTGKVESPTSATVVTRDGVASTLVTVPIPPDAQVVWVRLEGHTETLHYRIVNLPMPVSPGTAQSPGPNSSASASPGPNSPGSA